MYAGMIPTALSMHGSESQNGELMFWLFVPNQPLYNDTLTIWLNGGKQRRGGFSSYHSQTLTKYHCAVTPKRPRMFVPRRLSL